MTLDEELTRANQRIAELEARNAELLVAIDRYGQHDRNCEAVTESGGGVCCGCGLNDYSEALEARDRVRDAALIRLIIIAAKAFSTISVATLALNYLATDRESGEWQPELGD